MKLGIVLGLAVACLSGVTFAADRQEPYPPPFARNLREGQTMEVFLQSAMSPFRTAAGREDRLTREMIDRLAQRNDVIMKSMIVSQFALLDVNQDGVISRGEVEQSRTTPNPRIAPQFTQALLAADVDGDGNISISEAYKNIKTINMPGIRDDGLVAYLALGDGNSVTAAQVMDKAMTVFRSIDADGNIRLTGDEISRVAARILPDIAPRAASGLPAAASCDFPRPSATAETVLLGTYEGDAMASVHAGNPYDETTTSVITVQPGKTPLYIVVTSYQAQIWAVSGAVERVEKLVVVQPRGGAGSGVVGLAGDRVSFAGKAGQSCMNYFYKSGTRETAQARKTFMAMLGNDADHVGGIYSLSSVSVPDMAFKDLASTAATRVVPEDFDAASWESGLRFTPRGLVRYDPASVVASVPAKPYEVLPQEFGLSQLVHSGHLERLTPNVFRIEKPIAQFPAGLAGAHAVQFVLATGVPMPTGDPGHSCVVSEDTNEAVGKSAVACRMIRPNLDPQAKFK
jgi:hypothetical protein